MNHKIKYSKQGYLSPLLQKGYELAQHNKKSSLTPRMGVEERV